MVQDHLGLEIPEEVQERVENDFDKSHGLHITTSKSIWEIFRIVDGKNLVIYWKWVSETREEV